MKCLLRNKDTQNSVAIEKECVGIEIQSFRAMKAKRDRTREAVYNVVYLKTDKSALIYFTTSVSNRVYEYILSKTKQRRVHFQRNFLKGPYLSIATIPVRSPRVSLDVITKLLEFDKVLVM